MIGTSTLLKQELCKIEIMKELTDIARNTICTNSNNEFPYNVFIPTVKRRKGSNANEQDDEKVYTVLYHS